MKPYSLNCVLTIKPSRGEIAMNKRLYRSNSAMVGGVCAGLGEYFEVDPTFIRLAWAISFLIWGLGLLAYLAAWVIIPKVTT